MNTIDYTTKFKIEWAEGYEDVTSEYVDQELSLPEFIYIITKRHHEIATENIADGSYGCYDKHKVWVKFQNSDWEILDRFDLGNDDDFVYMKDKLTKALSDHLDWYWSDLVQKGNKSWEEKQTKGDE